MLMMVAAMLIFGTIGIFRRTIPLSSGFLAFARGLLGGLFLLLFVRLRGGRLRGGVSARQFAWLAFTGAAIGINWILLFEAYNYTTVAAATLCYYMQPTIVMLLSPALFQEKLTARKGLCALAAIVGMVLVSGVAGGGASGAGSPRGILYGLGAAVLYAAVVMMNKKAGKIDAYQKTTVQLFAASAVMIPYLLIMRDFGGGEWNTATVLLLLIVGIVHTGIAYVLYFGSMEGLKIQTIAIFSYIDPVSALLFSAVILHETLTPAGMVGAVLILGAALISEL